MKNIFKKIDPFQIIVIILSLPLLVFHAIMMVWETIVHLNQQWGDVRWLRKMHMTKDQFDSWMKFAIETKFPIEGIREDVYSVHRVMNDISGIEEFHIWFHSWPQQENRLLRLGKEEMKQFISQINASYEGNYE